MSSSSDDNDERKSRYGGGPHGLGKFIVFQNNDTYLWFEMFP